MIVLLSVNDTSDINGGKKDEKMISPLLSSQVAFWYKYHSTSASKGTIVGSVVVPRNILFHYYMRHDKITSVNL